jgi:ribonuclease T2
MHSFIFGAALLASAASAQLYPGQSKLNHTCQLQSPLLSCPSSDPSKVDSCCVETFGGLVLSTQFWNTYTGGEAQGQLLPTDTWTLHGLWVNFFDKLTLYPSKS